MLAIDDYRLPRVLVGCGLLGLGVDMKEFKGTPGKWVNVGGWVDSEGKHSKIICAIGSVSTQPEEVQEANANLIAAAPELLEALQLARHVIINMLPANSASRVKVDEVAGKAIAKALGESQ